MSATYWVFVYPRRVVFINPADGSDDLPDNTLMIYPVHGHNSVTDTEDEGKTTFNAALTQLRATSALMDEPGNLHGLVKFGVGGVGGVVPSATADHWYIENMLRLVKCSGPDVPKVTVEEKQIFETVSAASPMDSDQ